MLVEIKVPALAESVPDATCLEWYKKVGDFVAEGESLIDLETDKVTLEITASHSGIIKSISKNEGEVVLADDLLAVLDTDNAAEVEPLQKNNESFVNPSNNKAQEIEEPLKKAGPAARKLLLENDVDPNVVAGTGKGNRITKADVLSFINNSKLNDKTEASTADNNESTASRRSEKRLPMTRLRKRVAEKLLVAQKQNALLTTFNEVDMGAISDLRKLYKDNFMEKHDTKLGFMSFFVKAAIEALKNFPIINSSIEREDIVYHGYFDIGVAVGSGKGLVVPIIRDADLLSFAQIELSIKDFGDKAKTGKLTIENLTGGTFTISNGGIYGSLISTPIINSPQSAILGMHKIQDRPVARNGDIVIRPMMYLALTYDHRLIDGREAVQFLDSIRQFLEDPNRLLLEL